MRAQAILFFLAFSLNVRIEALEIDLSRRQKDLQKLRAPAQATQPTPVQADKAWLEGIFQSTQTEDNLVIMHTDNGFVPSQLNLKKGRTYRVHVINVSQKQKNASFVLNAFAENHGTYFGQPQVFTITPKTEGMFSFSCPESAEQGRLVVTSDRVESRLPASVDP